MRWGTVENRISPRKHLRMRVVFEDEFSEEFLYFLSTDISVSGLFIESPIHLQEKTQMFLKFALREGETPIQVVGSVIRFMEPRRGRGRRKKKARLGIGIRFLGLNPQDLRRIEDYISA
ncbi:MAG: PilZ domain-containing protein [Deltaproteobacteria bacterium]|nr:PilZ domain-containing protein [Deltaproteobacteria bacterium]